MPKRSSTRDPNVNAFAIMQRTTAETVAPIAESLDNVALRKQLMREMGRRGGLKGGKARAASLSKKTRSQIAKRAAKARWKN